MLGVFFDAFGAIYQHVVPPKTKINVFNYWDLNLEFQMLVALRMITTSE